jgi:uncharacterized protein YcfJ|tara:strand:+ start:5320 stop:5874 length:555 start_codon:yes stop_codon:yes gene_type:complete
MKMNAILKSTKRTSLAMVLCVSATAAATPALAANISYDYATVIESKPIVKTVRVSTPRRECWDEEVVYRDRHDDSGVGPVVGAVLGGALGNAVGHHKRNKQVGAVVGAVLGATLGHAAANNAKGRHESHYRTEERCEVIQEFHEEDRIIGYRVRYRYRDATYTTRTDIDPGDTLKVRVAVSPAF